MEIKKNIQLKDYSTFKIGGPAKFFCEVRTIEDLSEALTWARENKQRFFILGGGSNILFMDKGFDGLVVKVNNEEIKIVSSNENGVIVSCGAGAKFSNLVKFSLENKLSGLEWAIGVPGEVGGAVRGNAGCFGGEMKDVVKKVEVLKIEKGEKEKKVALSNQECKFDYRNSIFKMDPSFVIWDCELELKKGDINKSKKEIHEIIKKRKERQPALSEFPSIGSVFKNPKANQDVIRQFEEDNNVKCRGDKVPAGWIIEQCDLKKKRIGGAMLSDQQANFILNMGNATADDVLILISLVKMKVRNKFNVQLEEEAQIVM
ncbi:MAG: UDP-N-acetylmuramate dehydrogenase [Patescibacteria group bacterium]|nr:UDP-N-acetylmuramate dehydrogenase [Patescibacteria group bacterium]